ncbi:pyridoxal phosphate-dependent aminotransferase [Dongia sedimenti]|uniref:Aminotransferase n=1 Tax=Dongia sedimenti TaxID=3064282 RepID=A0ABU0YTJ5_9PROT|nr:pyridoxal phosphate-dependent aminotransferase [Rhodospirillaceae bacterium R-7]
MSNAMQSHHARDIVSRRLAGINPSETVAAAARMSAMKAAGRDVIALTSGSPDFDTPEHVRQAATLAIERGETRYTDVKGTAELRRAIAAKFERDSGIRYELDEIMASTGAKQVIYNAMLATINPGDEAIIPAPCWVSYPDIVGLAEGKPVIVPCKAESGFKLQAAQLEVAITPKTRWLILNNPCNPTGAVYTKSDLRPLCDVLLRHPDILILCDDIYEKIVYGTAKPATIVEVEPKLKDRTVTVNGCSKAYAMTGWRLGFCGAPRELITEMTKLQGQSTSPASSIGQAAALAALTGPQDVVTMMAQSYKERRDLALDILRNAPGLDCRVPDGAFYLFPSVRACFGRTSGKGRQIEDDIGLAAALAEEEGVGVVCGTAFLSPGHVRMSYVIDRESLQEACRRMVRFFERMTPRI